MWVMWFSGIIKIIIKNSQVHKALIEAFMQVLSLIVWLNWQDLMQTSVTYKQ